jgi:dipeptidyl-peptidase-3
MLGYPDTHLSNYYSPNVGRDDIDVAQRFMESRSMNAYNTRLLKDGNDLIIRVASAAEQLQSAGSFEFEGRRITISYGDYREQMCRIADSIASAAQYAANEIQTQMLCAYEESFRTGSIDAHKQSQRYWIKDIGPVVESNIGFIESYRDPAGVRGEWEGFVAMVNKEQTEKFQALVDNAVKFIGKLPWGSAFEKDQFHKPDFTSLEVLSFCTSGIPAGINIPK